ncbi:MAG: hypothetical protein D6704_02710 [Nitrospirae bacterium]|nr:MAG: hypothetical protein D6704_02710 [Nitrospirota bacterium]
MVRCKKRITDEWEAPEERSGKRGAARRVVPERRYRKPPVIEALCEIYFAGSSWDETIPGAFYQQIKDDYPKKQQ